MTDQALLGGGPPKPIALKQVYQDPENLADKNFPPSGAAPMKLLTSKFKIAGTVITVVATLYVAWSSATLFEPRVSTEEGLAALKELRQVSDSASKEMWKISADHGFRMNGERAVTTDYIAGVNHLAAGAAAGRAAAFERGQAFVWIRVLDDIEDLHRELGGFGSLQSDDALQRVQELNDALALVAKNGEKAMDTLVQTKKILATEKSTPYTDLRLIRTLLKAAENEHLLIYDSGRIPFADLAQLQSAHWSIFELHQQMERDYHAANRVPTAVHVLIGR